MTTKLFRLLDIHIYLPLEFNIFYTQQKSVHIFVSLPCEKYLHFLIKKINNLPTISKCSQQFSTGKIDNYTIFQNISTPISSLKVLWLSRWNNSYLALAWVTVWMKHSFFVKESFLLVLDLHEKKRIVRKGDYLSHISFRRVLSSSFELTLEAKYANSGLWSIRNLIHYILS